MKRIPANSIDAIITDPPYGLKFMNRKWDDDCPKVDIWRECLRTLKPGGHLLSFSGTRTTDLVMGRIREAGFEIRDMLVWLYGQGFPKSRDIGKAIDKEAGIERQVVGTKLGVPAYSLNPNQGRGVAMSGNVDGSLRNPEKECEITAPATLEAQEWDGWGTGLKPACEPITMARKPFKGPVHKNVLEHGTGAVNVDGCRIPIDLSKEDRAKCKNTVQSTSGIDFKGAKKGSHSTPLYKLDEGRWPANVIFDPEAAALLDEQTGVSKSSGGGQKDFSDSALFQGETVPNRTGSSGFGDTGGASRFFYCAKASRKERNAGLERFEEKHHGCYGDVKGTDKPQQIPNTHLKAPNFHPTVKPIAVMRWLVRLITPPGGIVLDPFAGSGTTLIAAELEKFEFVGIELQQEYVAIAKARLKHWSTAGA